MRRRPAPRDGPAAGTGPRRPERVQAVVLSGGGAYAAYEIGVLRALVTGRSPSTGYRPIDPRIVSGTSAGALNSALLVCHGHLPPAAAVDAIERVWMEDMTRSVCGNPVFRWRGSPLNAFDFECLAADPAAYFRDRAEDLTFFAGSFLDRARIVASRTSEPLERRLLEVVNFSNLIDTSRFPDFLRKAVDFAAIRRSRRRLQVVTTNWRTGEERVFSNEDMDDMAGPLIVAGSCAIPGIFPPVEIPPEIFSDGGLVMNTPLSPPLREGADVLHVVYLDPDIERIPLSDLQTTLDTLQRSFSISVAHTFNRDIENARNINLGIELLERPERASGIPEREARHFTAVAPVLLERLARGRPLRRVTIHRYHPGDLLGGPLDVLSFEPGLVRSLIDRGYRDAVAHDCAAAGCVLPEGSRQAGRADRADRAGRGRGPAPPRARERPRAGTGGRW